MAWNYNPTRSNSSRLANVDYSYLNKGVADMHARNQSTIDAMTQGADYALGLTPDQQRKKAAADQQAQLAISNKLDRDQFDQRAAQLKLENTRANTAATRQATLASQRKTLFDQGQAEYKRGEDARIAKDKMDTAMAENPNMFGNTTPAAPSERPQEEYSDSALKQIGEVAASQAASTVVLSPEASKQFQADTVKMRKLQKEINGMVVSPQEIEAEYRTEKSNLDRVFNAGEIGLDQKIEWEKAINERKSQRTALITPVNEGSFGTDGTWLSGASSYKVVTNKQAQDHRKSIAANAKLKKDKQAQYDKLHNKLTTTTNRLNKDTTKAVTDRVAKDTKAYKAQFKQKPETAAEYNKRLKLGLKNTPGMTAPDRKAASANIDILVNNHKANLAATAADNKDLKKFATKETVKAELARDTYEYKATVDQLIKQGEPKGNEKQKEAYKIFEQQVKLLTKGEDVVGSRTFSNAQRGVDKYIKKHGNY